MKLWRIALFAVLHGRAGNLPHSDTTLSESPQGTPDRIGCWLEKTYGQLVQEGLETNPCVNW